MAVVLGTSSGFVTVAPTADPAGTGTTIDGSSVVTKHTSPVGATKITEIGWYRASGTNTINWEIALYADSAGAAGARLFVDATNSTSSNGWVVVAVDWTISASTAYWLALQMDAHSGSSSVDAAASGGAGSDILASQTTLADPYGGGAVADADGMYAIYALVTVLQHRTLTADQYSMTESGQAATPKAARLLTSAQASISLAGQAILFGFGYTMTALPVDFTETGQALNLLAARLLTAAQQSKTLSAQNAGVLRGYPITAQQASLGITEQNSGITLERLLSASQASMTESAQASNVLRGSLVSADQDIYTLTPQDIDFSNTLMLLAGMISFSTAAQNAGFNYDTGGGGGQGNDDYYGDNPEEVAILRRRGRQKLFNLATYDGIKGRETKTNKR